MDAEQELALIALMEWEERRDRWLAFPGPDRDRVVQGLADLMVRIADREAADDGRFVDDHPASS